MKRLFVISFFMIYLASQMFAQHGEGRRQKLAQLEQSKLIEVLDMDEETSIRFFARRKQSMEQMQKFFKRREALLDSLNKSIEDENTAEGEKLLEKIFKIESRIFRQRAGFVKSLRDILPAEKIQKFVYFDYRFKREMREILMNRRKKGRGKE